MALPKECIMNVHDLLIALPLQILRGPDGLDDLEEGRSNHHKHEKSNELWTDWVVVILLGGLADVASLVYVLSVLLVGLLHLWCGGHREIGNLSLVEVNQAILA